MFKGKLERKKFKPTAKCFLLNFYYNFVNIDIIVNITTYVCYWLYTKITP